MCVQIFIYIQFLFLFDFRYIVVVLVVSHVKKVPYFSSIDFFYFYEICFFSLMWECGCVCVNLRGFVGYTYSYVLLLLLVFSSPPAITTTMMILLIPSRRHARFHKYHEISGWREQMDFNYIFIIYVCVCVWYV